MPEIHYIESKNFDIFFSKLKDSHKVFSTFLKDENKYKDKPDYFYRRLAKEDRFVYNAYRAIEPLKSFFTHGCEKVSDYFTDKKEIEQIKGESIIFGVKSCDIVGHKIQDFVFLEGVEVDSLYKLRREKTLIISSDCTGYKEVCHCLAWDIMPYPVSGFDLNLSPLSDGYLVEVGSVKAKFLIDRNKEYFTPAKETQVGARVIKREGLVECLKKHLAPQNLVKKDIVQRLMKEGFALETWKEFMKTCVECGGCNLICDTCHCFILSDKKSDQLNQKLRVWDSCLYANYAKVAGGANPLKLRAQRLRNRFMKKFDFFVEHLKMPACCGCGRCIEVCPGKIDIREVLKDLAKRLNLLTQ